MKKILEAVKKDLWVVLLDVVAVNLSYYLALLIRFYVNFQLRPVAVDRYLPAWLGLKLENVGAVFIADPLITTEERARIRKAADAAGADVQDYTGFFSNLGGQLSLTELLSTIHGPLTISLDGKDTRYEDGAAALESLKEKYEVKSIEGDMKIVLQKSGQMSTQEALKAAYSAVMGE